MVARSEAATEAVAAVTVEDMAAAAVTAVAAASRAAASVVETTTVEEAAEAAIEEANREAAVATVAEVVTTVAAAMTATATASAIVTASAAATEIATENVAATETVAVTETGTEGAIQEIETGTSSALLLSCAQPLADCWSGVGPGIDIMEAAAAAAIESESEIEIGTHSSARFTLHARPVHCVSPLLWPPRCAHVRYIWLLGKVLKGYVISVCSHGLRAITAVITVGSRSRVVVRVSLCSSYY